MIPDRAGCPISEKVGHTYLDRGRSDGIRQVHGDVQFARHSRKYCCPHTCRASCVSFISQIQPLRHENNRRGGNREKRWHASLRVMPRVANIYMHIPTCRFVTVLFKLAYNSSDQRSYALLRLADDKQTTNTFHQNGLEPAPIHLAARPMP